MGSPFTVSGINFAIGQTVLKILINFYTGQIKFYFEDAPRVIHFKGDLLMYLIANCNYFWNTCEPFSLH